MNWPGQLEATAKILRSFFFLWKKSFNMLTNIFKTFFLFLYSLALSPFLFLSISLVFLFAFVFSYKHTVRIIIIKSPPKIRKDFYVVDQRYFSDFIYCPSLPVFFSLFLFSQLLCFPKLKTWNYHSFWFSEYSTSFLYLMLKIYFVLILFYSEPPSNIFFFLLTLFFCFFSFSLPLSLSISSSLFNFFLFFLCTALANDVSLLL